MGRLLSTDSAPREVVDEVVAILREFHPEGQRTVVRAFGEADLRDVLPRIEVPTLLIYGDRDVRSPVSVGQALHAQIAVSRLAVIPGAAHLCDMEAPERFNVEVRHFLAWDTRLTVLCAGASMSDPLGSVAQEASLTARLKPR